MKYLILITLLFTSYFESFAQTKLLIDRRDGKKDTIAVNTISQIKFSYSNNYQPSLLEVVTVLDSANIKFIEYANATNGDLSRTLELTELWLLSQPTVKIAYSMNDETINIVLKSGLQTAYSVIETDKDGFSKTRGGEVLNKDATNKLLEYGKEILSKNNIENKKVLLFESSTKDLDLEPQIKTTTDLLNNSGLGLDITILRDDQCTMNIVETFPNYGLVIIDGHGLKESFQFNPQMDFKNVKKTEEDLLKAIDKTFGSGASDKFKTGKIYFAVYNYINLSDPNWPRKITEWQKYNSFISGKYIQSLPEMPNTVIFGNFCYSGWILPSLNFPEKKYIDLHLKEINEPAHKEDYPYAIGTSFISRKLISYYGYTRNQYTQTESKYPFYSITYPPGSSRKVENSYAIQMENLLLKRLVKDKDSTGIANLKADNKTEDYSPDKPYPGDLFFRHYGADDYSYLKCGDTLKDTRDGQKYTTVCIGKQNWMAQNLNYNAPGSVTYGNNPANGPIYGRLYNIKTIMQGAASSNANPSGVTGICPKGWHVPSKDEFETLFDAVGFNTAGGALKAKVLWDAPNTGATNSSGFTGLPGGTASDMATPGTFGNLGKWGYFATTTNEPGGWLIYLLVHDGSDVQGTNVPFEKQGVSCRCLKD